MNRRTLVAALLSLAAAAGCEKAPPPPRPVAPPPPPIVPVAGRDAATNPELEAETAPTPDAAAPRDGDFSIAGAYKVALDEVRPCNKGAPSLDGAGGPRSWVGALVRVGAQVNGFTVSPRDFTLERHGVIIQAAHVNPPTLPGCLPLLPVNPMRAGEMARGFAVFDVSERFRNDGKGPFVFAYHPTRWGGAKRIEREIPPCLDACGGAPPDEKSRDVTKEKNRDAAAAKPRRKKS